MFTPPRILSSLATSAILALGVASSAQTTGPGEAGMEQPVYAAQSQRMGLPGLAREYATRSAQAAAAQDRYTDAQNRLTAAVSRLHTQMQSAPELKDAHKKIDQAAGAYEAAKIPVLDEVRGTPEYRRAMAERDRVNAELQKLTRSQPDITPQRVALAKQKMRYGTIGHEMEFRAVQADPKVREAHDNLMQAWADLANVRQALNQKIDNNPEVVAAKRDLQDSYEQLVDASTELAGASAAYFQALDDRDLNAYVAKHTGGLAAEAGWGWGWGWSGRPNLTGMPSFPFPFRDHR